jgi:hypothetical protein
MDVFHRMKLSLASSGGVLSALCLGLTASLHAADRVSFNRDIRPILSDKCFHCHGPDANDIKGKLRLDLRESALKGGKSGDPAITPGKPDQSELLARLVTTNLDDRMPPEKTHKTVTPQEVELVRRWIAEGAEYQGHWAFIAPVRPAVPTLVGRKSDTINPIDAFIRARLAQAGLPTSPEAPRETLIRRVSLDLTGLPPTPGEVEAFIADQSPNAYEKAVDRLLASPRHGEHMAAQWLDLARYADSNGFQSDTRRAMWHWRDWAINAFNENKPFDQFTIEQLAGDLLPNATRDQIVATGFNRNHRLNGEGGRIVEEWFAETVIDRVETTGLTWMAITFNCARCHDHKYDPISQKEFYQIFAFFNSNDELGVMDEFGGGGSTRKGGNSKPVLQLSTPEEQAKIAKADADVKAAEKSVADATRQLPALQAQWETEFRREIENTKRAWTPLASPQVKSLGGATLAKQADDSWLAGGKNPANDTYEVTAAIQPGQFTGVLLEVFPDKTLPNESLGRGHNGNFILTGMEAEISAPGLTEPLVAHFTRAKADYEQKDWEVKHVLPADAAAAAPKKKGARAKPAAKEGGKGWAVDGNAADKRLPRKALFACEPLAVPANATLTVRLLHASGNGDHNVGRFRLSSSSIAPAALALGGTEIPKVIRAALGTNAAGRTAEQKKELAKFYRDNTDNPAKKADARLASAKKSLADLQANLDNTMIFREIAKPRDAFLLVRGQYDKKGDKVERGLPAALPPLPAGEPTNRLGFARWLVSPGHPLTARVWVNRTWEKFFGTGLVKSTENLGSQSEWPSHPELLDWLAVEFMQPTVLPAVNGQAARPWDMKAMQKFLVMSATYRQSARVTPEMLEKDPENRLLARGPRFRLSAEMVRDQALALSGLLVEKVGGPSVYPYMPEKVWDETSVYGDMRNYKVDTGEGLYRRTLYTVWKRTAAPPSMLLFDSPSREICTVKRSRSNTPLQALALLNEVTYVEAARQLAGRMLAEGGATPEARIGWAFRQVTGRKADASEVALLARGLNTRLDRFTKDADSAKKIIAVGAAKPDAKWAAAELAAYTTTANVLLNLDEVVTRE